MNRRRNAKFPQCCGQGELVLYNNSVHLEPVNFWICDIDEQIRLSILTIRNRLKVKIEAQFGRGLWEK